MSWDTFVQDLPPGIASISDIPDDFEPSPIGLRSDIIAKVSALYPECVAPSSSISARMKNSTASRSMFAVTSVHRPSWRTYLASLACARWTPPRKAASSSKMLFCGPNHLPVGDRTATRSSEVALADPMMLRRCSCAESATGLGGSCATISSAFAAVLESPPPSPPAPGRARTDQLY